MPRFGFGFGSHQSNARFIALGASATLPVVSPAPAWTGQPGSGFDAVPVDSPSTGPKSILQLIVPPNQFFSDELLVGVMGGANEKGSLLANMGLEGVEVNFEGMSRTIAAPSFQTFADANGTYRTYFGWWALLRHDGRNGHGRVFFKAKPRDKSIAARVIGPFQFSPQASVHDGRFTVASTADANFQTVGQALSHCRTTGLANPLITIVEAGEYDIADTGQPYEGAGYCTITAAVPDVRIAKPSYSGDSAAALRSRYGGLRFKGSNLSIDMRFISHIHSENGSTRPHWLDGCAIMNSAGPGATWRGALRPVTGTVPAGAWYTECVSYDSSDTFANAKLVRGTNAIGGYGDLYAACPAVIGNTSTSLRSDRTLARDVPALDVRYDGTAASATIELAGEPGAATRLVTVRVAGNPDRNFTLQNSDAAYTANTNYSLANLVAWLKTLPGISATAVDTSWTRAATWLGLSDTAASPFGARNIKDTTLNLVTHIGVKSSLWRVSGDAQNMVVWGNAAIDMAGRSFDLDGQGARHDLLIANNAVQNVRPVGSELPVSSCLDGAHNHVLMVHNTLSTQGMTLRTDRSFISGPGCLIGNNSFAFLAWGANPASTPIVENHIHEQQAAPASLVGLNNVSNTTIGGNETSLYVNDQEGDFTAQGELLTNLAPSVLRYGAVGEPIPPLHSKGSGGGLVLSRPVDVGQTQSGIASSVSQYGITWNFSEPRPVARYANGDWAVEGPVTIISITPGGETIDGQFADNFAYTGRQVHGAVLNAGNRSQVGGSKSGNSGLAAGTGHIQGWDGIEKSDLPPGKNGNTLPPYVDALNVDPGNTGQPLVLTTGSVVKAVSAVKKAEVDPYGAAMLTDLAVLTVVDTLPAGGDMRPGIAGSDKSSPFNKRSLNLSVFRNLPIPGDAPPIGTVLSRMSRLFQLAVPNSIDAKNLSPKNNHDVYGREIGDNVTNALLYLHLAIPGEQKLELLVLVAQLAIDAASRADEGGIGLTNGGGNAWKRAALVMTCAALGLDCPTWMRAAAQNNAAWTEDIQVLTITAGQVEATKQIAGTTPGYPDRPLSRFEPWMIGGNEWGAGGSNWTEVYRDITGSYVFGAVLAVRLTAGAEGPLWNNPPVFDYFLASYWHHEVVQRLAVQAGLGTNAPSRFHSAMSESYRPAIVDPPRVTAFVNGSPSGTASPTSSDPYPGSVLRLVSDKAFDMTRVPSANAFTVRVDGAVVPFTLAGIWRNVIGLLLTQKVTRNQSVTVAYAPPPSDRARSVDGVELAAISPPMEADNITPSIGGDNASYPVVKFASSDRYEVVSSGQKLGANSAQGTLWISHFKLLTSTPGTFFGTLGGNPPIRLTFSGNTALRIQLRDTTGGIVAQLITTPLTVGSAYSIRADWDLSDPSAASGFKLRLNGNSAIGAGNSWSGGSGKEVHWSRNVGQKYMVGSTAIELGGLWLNTTERVTDPTQVAKFSELTNGSLGIGTLGAGITGTQPQVFLVGDASQWNDPAGINRGSSAKFFKITSSPGVTGISGNKWT